MSKIYISYKEKIYGDWQSEEANREDFIKSNESVVDACVRLQNEKGIYSFHIFESKEDLETHLDMVDKERPNPI